MRERIAVAISVLAVAVLAGLSLVFAFHQNPATAASSALDSDMPAAPLREDTVLQQRAVPVGDSIAGYAVFRAWGCERCHSVRGVGSPRFPLDGVGLRRTPDELNAWTVGAPAVRDSLSPSALRAKRRYEQIPDEEMRVLIAWMRLLQR